MTFTVWVVLFFIPGVIRWHIVHSFFSAIIAFSFLIIIRNSNAFSSYPVRIEAFFVAFPVLTLSPVRIINRFSVVFSASAKSLP
jgi:hypothetical protein